MFFKPFLTGRDVDEPFNLEPYGRLVEVAVAVLTQVRTVGVLRRDTAVLHHPLLTDQSINQLIS